MRRFALTAPIETERLTLRAYADTDFDWLLALRSDPEVARYLYWEPQTAAEVRETLERGAGEYRTAGIIATAVAWALQALTVLIDQAAKMGADG
mgnify:CR=1 FL=1